MPIKVTIVEDDARLRGNFVGLISSDDDFQCIGEYPNAEVALKTMPGNWPDVVLMDINLPKASGIECVARLKELRPKLHIIMVTMYVDEDKIFDSLKAGASGYLIKKTAPEEILEAIRTVNSGGAPMSNTIALKVVQFFKEKPSTDETRNLTPREIEILTQLAKGYHYKEIASALFISVETVRSHLQHIYEKLHVRSRTEAVVKFLGKGKSV
jgi:DNA-binding NarL/FixJ family response regulator